MYIEFGLQKLITKLDSKVPKNLKLETPQPTQIIGRLFSPSQKVKKLSHPFRLCFELSLGIHVHHAKY